MLIDHGAIAIALYRECTDANKSMLPYIFAGPPPDTIVRAGDRVFLLAPDANVGSMFSGDSRPFAHATHTPPPSPPGT